MKKLTTTIAEMNRLYGEYYEAFCKEDYATAELTWNDYRNYTRRFTAERGLQPLPEPRPDN